MRELCGGSHRPEDVVDEVGERVGLVEQHRRVVAEEEHRRHVDGVGCQVEQPEVAEAVRGHRQTRGQQLGGLDAVPLAGEVQVEEGVGPGGHGQQARQLAGERDPEWVVCRLQPLDRGRVQPWPQVQLDRVAVLVLQAAGARRSEQPLHGIHAVTVGP